MKELIFNSFCFGWSRKNSFLAVSTLGGSGGLERTDFLQLLHWESVVVLKELIFNSFYFGWSSGLERTDFNSFYFGWVWWS